MVGKAPHRSFEALFQIGIEQVLFGILANLETVSQNVIGMLDANFPVAQFVEAPVADARDKPRLDGAMWVELAAVKVQVYKQILDDILACRLAVAES